MLLEGKDYIPPFQISLKLSMQEKKDRSDSISEDNLYRCRLILVLGIQSICSGLQRSDNATFNI